MESNIVQDSSIKIFLVKIASLPLTLVGYVARFFTRVFSKFTPTELEFESPTLLNPTGILLFILGLIYIFYLFNKHFDFFNKLRTLFPNFSETEVGKFFVNVWYFIFGLCIKFIGKIIDSKLQAKFTTVCSNLWENVKEATSGQTSDGSATTKMAYSFSSQVFYILSIISACITIAVLVDFLFSILTGKTVEETILNLLYKSIDNVMKHVYLMGYYVMKGIWTVIIQVYYIISFTYK